MKNAVTKITDYVAPELKMVALSEVNVITMSGEPNSKGWDDGKMLGEFEDYVGGF